MGDVVLIFKHGCQDDLNFKKFQGGGQVLGFELTNCQIAEHIKYIYKCGSPRVTEVVKNATKVKTI